MRSEYKQVKETGALRGTVPGALKALAVSLGLTFIIFLVSALLLTYTKLSEGAIPFITLITVVLSVVTGGGMLAKTAGKRGYLNGALAGILYALVLYGASLCMGGGIHAYPYIFVLLAICLVGGAFGGIMGINLTGKRKH